MRLFFWVNILSNSLSKINRIMPPVRKPRVGINQELRFKEILVSIAGAISEKYDAEVITPAAKPNIPSIIDLLIVLKKKTIPEPNKVIRNVNNVANRALKI